MWIYRSLIYDEVTLADMSHLVKLDVIDTSVPKSVTANDCEWRNGYFCFISPKAVCESDARYLCSS